MSFKVLSVNVSAPKSVTHRGNEVSTGIFKEPVDGPVLVRQLNLDGDRQADLDSHGGICKAVYAYPIEHYEYWARDLDRSDLSYGQFGENLTVEGLLESDVSIGDVLELGSTVLEVTQPRVPCFKLAIRMEGLADFPRRFLKSGFVGFYLRVLKEGEISAGMTIDRSRVAENSMSIRDVHTAMHFDKKNLDAAKRALDISALSPGWHRAFERRLVAAGVSVESRPLPLENECCVGL